MIKTKQNPLAAGGALLEQILAGAHADDEQLRALRDAISAGLELPLDVHLAGVPLSLLSVGYDGNPRRGLTARCRREDGSEHQVALADVRPAPASAGYVYLAAYWKWLGIESTPATKVSPPARVRQHKASAEDIDLSGPVDVVVLEVKQVAARCRLLGSERLVTLRAGSLRSIVPGQIARVQPSKHWRHAGRPYLSGKILSTRVDAAALGLVPLELRQRGQWEASDEYWGEPGELIDDWARPIIARGPRPMFEMEQALPGRDEDFDFDFDPILQASDLKRAGDTAGAQGVLQALLKEDLRCLDAHAHLGNILFRFSPDWALKHYEVGVSIGELSLGDRFDGVLAWGFIDNRPFLRCLQGQALCLWRLECWQESAVVLERMLWLNPSDNQGMRSLLPDVRRRVAWANESG